MTHIKPKHPQPKLQDGQLWNFGKDSAYTLLICGGGKMGWWFPKGFKPTSKQLQHAHNFGWSFGPYDGLDWSKAVLVGNANGLDSSENCL